MKSRTGSMYQLGQAGRNRRNQEIRENANEHNECRQREEWDHLTQIRVWQPTPFGVEWAIEDALKHPEQVTGCQNHREDRDCGRYRPDFITGSERDIFCNETGQAWETERG